MSIETTLLKIEADLDGGRKGLAVKRLRSLIKTNPTNILLRNRLAEIYYDAGFIDTAGLYWLLSEPKNNKMRHAVAVYKQTAGSAQQILDDLGRLKDIEKLDNFSKHELEAYQFQYKKKMCNLNGVQMTYGEKSTVLLFSRLLDCALFGA